VIGLPIDDEPVVHQLQTSGCPVERVTVYSDRAECTRLVKIVAAKPGLQNIVIGGFSPKVNQNTIRVSGGVGHTTILEVSFSIIHPEYVSPEVKEEDTKRNKLQEKLDTLEEKIINLKAEHTRLQAEETWLHAYTKSQVSPSVVPGEHVDSKEPTLKLLSPEEAQQLMQLYRKNLDRLTTQKFELNKLINDIKKEVLLVKNDMTKAPPVIPAERREVIIEISVAQSGPVVLHVSYVVMDASWTSLYDVRVEPDQENCKLIYYGVITNLTGEDWKEVELSLSTAEPSIGGLPPAMYPIHVQFDPPIHRIQVLSRSLSDSAEEDDESGSGSGSDDERKRPQKKLKKKKKPRCV